MKTISVRDLQKNIRNCVEQAQRDRVVITRRGRPAAVLIGVEGADWETLVTATDDAFWRLIEARRREHTVPIAVMRRRLGAGHTAPGRRRIGS